MHPDRLIRRNEPLPELTSPWCGIDEAGRGPLAGPVVAAAVILAPADPIAGLRDSKSLSPAQRSRLASQIRAHALAWQLGQAEVGEIDQLNILQATLLAMRRALEGLTLQPTLIAVDGLYCPAASCLRLAIVGGDQRLETIAAASILAKSARDAQMELLAQRYPEYQFERHKGYPTALHLEMLRRHGPCPQHRLSFRGVPSSRSLAPVTLPS